MSLSLEKIVDEFRVLIDDKSIDEETIHQCLVRYPMLLPLWYPHENIVFSKLKLGNEHIVDFAFGRENTPGFTWHLVEIEKPHDRLFTKSGNPTAKLSHALRQVHDWASWFEDNRDYVRRHLPFSAAIDQWGMSKPELIVVIGRRTEVADMNRALLRRLSDHQVRIMTFDRLVDELAWPSIERDRAVVCCNYTGGKIKELSSIKINVTYSLEQE